MPSHLCLAHYGPGLIGYQTGACIVRQAQERTGSEYTVLTGLIEAGGDVRRLKVHHSVRWDKPHMRIEIQSARGTGHRCRSTAHHALGRGTRTSQVIDAEALIQELRAANAT